MPKDPEIRDKKVKAEQEFARKYLATPSITGASKIERAMAVYMEANEVLLANGVHVTQQNTPEILN